MKAPLLYYPAEAAGEEKLRRLRVLAPDKAEAIDTLTDAALRESWPQRKPRSPKVPR